MNIGFNKKDGLLLKLFEVFIDILLVNLAYYIAFQLRYNFHPALRNIEPYYDIIVYISIATFLIFTFMNTLSRLNKAMVDIVFNLIISLLLLNITTAALAFFNRGFPFPRSIFLIAFILQLILMSLSKTLFSFYMKKSYSQKKIMIIGSKKEAENIATRLLLNKLNLDNLRYICNHVDDKLYALIEDVDKIYVGASISGDIKSEIISYCIGKDKLVYLVPELFEIAMINAKTVQLDDIPVFEIDNFHLSMENMVIKRAFDLIFSTIALLITLPSMAVIALIIKIYDGGPVFFKQVRITQGNKEFKVYKFRTMVVNAEKKTGPVLAKDKDPRITPLGRFLRATRLDELPQFFNVFKGDMSLVGPRPEREHFINEFTKNIPHFKYRVVVKAGITGLAQVLGKYTTSPEDKVRFDLLYIRNYSFLLDLKILVETLKVIFTKESSAGMKKERTIEELFSELDIKVSREMSITKVEN
ncbi:MAG: sugar transferase [Halanaerobiales bacterium]